MSWRSAHRSTLHKKDSFPRSAKEQKTHREALDTLLSIGEPNALHEPRAPQRSTLTHKHAQQHHRKNCRGRLLAEEKIDSEADMLSGISRKRNAHSSYY